MNARNTNLRKNLSSRDAMKVGRLPSSGKVLCGQAHGPTEQGSIAAVDVAALLQKLVC